MTSDGRAGLRDANFLAPLTFLPSMTRSYSVPAFLRSASIAAAIASRDAASANVFTGSLRNSLTFSRTVAMFLLGDGGGISGQTAAAAMSVRRVFLRADA